MKRLVVCIDGTGNDTEVGHPDPKITNVLRIARAIRQRTADRKTLQFVEYFSGVGTGVQAELSTGLKGLALGFGLKEKIQRAYDFLTLNYETGDEVFLFGFSRGAVIVRSLASFIGLVGILDKRNADSFEIAWRYYQHVQDNGDAVFLPDNLRGIIDAGKQMAAIGQRDGMNWDTLRTILNDQPTSAYRWLPLQFVGVWDTVRGLVGKDEGKHDLRLPWNVGFAAQALALHEYRGMFAPSIWRHKLKYQTVRQVWFPGAHSDVGGGAKNVALSSAPLGWMIAQAEAQHLEFDPGYRQRKDILDPQITAPISYPARSLAGQWTGRMGRWMRAAHRLPLVGRAFPIGARAHEPRTLGTSPLQEHRHRTVEERLLTIGEVSYSFDQPLLRGIDRCSMTLPEEPVDACLSAAIAHAVVAREAADAATAAADEARSATTLSECTRATDRATTAQTRATEAAQVVDDQLAAARPFPDAETSILTICSLCAAAKESAATASLAAGAAYQSWVLHRIRSKRG